MNKCEICLAKLKLVESITNKCSYCNKLFCKTHALPTTNENNGHLCEDFIKALSETNERKRKLSFTKRKLEEI